MASLEREVIELLLAEQRRAIDQGDQALRDHIAQQIASTEAAFKAADALEKERVTAVRDVIEARTVTAEAARKELERSTAQRFEELEDGVKGCMTRAEYDHRHEDLVRRMSALEIWQANITGRVVGVGLLTVIFTAAITTLVTHVAG